MAFRTLGGVGVAAWLMLGPLMAGPAEACDCPTGGLVNQTFDDTAHRYIYATPCLGFGDDATINGAGLDRLEFTTTYTHGVGCEVNPLNRMVAFLLLLNATLQNHPVPNNGNAVIYEPTGLGEHPECAKLKYTQIVRVREYRYGWLYANGSTCCTECGTLLLETHLAWMSNTEWEECGCPEPQPGE